ncbi:DUF4011 domain-containing protein [Hymenobacter sp. 5516J-16]|uniref:DUF4011 domain-containing protein n=1 Tax=Hymenobacter sp. 5516J-16 TaxID=2932253 RepID=UPI001FD28C40|nr:DUF4011 domain-containing protein [Hymenobacter sp. 5516J-16]UOQ75495.1 DUF4011 domain-containing protein [Hymenobacter sp. 5516J-16]
MSAAATASSPSATLATRLEAARQELLDLGLRNPLLNFRPSPARGVLVVGEEAGAVYEVLVRQGKTMYFQGAPGSRKTIKSPDSVQFMSGFTPLEAAAAGLSEAEAQAQRDAYYKAAQQPVPSPTELTEVERHALLTDNKLQTADPVDKLENRLLNTYYTARTSLEETGVNILYLALGQLTWYEANSSLEPHCAPLLLVPVLLERGTAAERFRLRHTGAEIEGNLSLQAKLRVSFG